MTIDTYTLRRLARSTADKVLGAESAKAADHIDAQAAEIARLRAALEAIGTYPLARGQEMSAESMRKIARAALAQEQGGSDAT